MNLGDKIGDFTPGKSADFVYLRAPTQDRHPRLSEILTLADSSWIKRVYVEGDSVHDIG